MAGELNPTAAINFPATSTAAAVGEKNLGPKRQRRPSVRLGEIGGDKPSSNTGLLRPKPPSYKTRPLTNLVNKDEFEFDDDIEKAAKRPLTNFSINNNNNQEEDEEIGDEDEEQQQQNQLSADSGESGDERVFQVWHAHNRRSTRPINTTTNNNINNNDALSGAGFRGLDIGVKNWLIDLGLARYAPVFEIHEVDDDVLPLLTLEDLKDMGINAVGSRRKLYAAILNLRKGLS